MLVRISIIIACVSILVACGGGSSSPTPPASTPSVSLSATTLTFATAVGVSQNMTVTVTDNGTAADTFTGFTISGTNASNFSQTNTCGTGIAEGANCTVTVTFVSSTAASGLTAGLAIVGNAGTQNVALNGTAAAPTATLTPAAGLTFASQNVGSSSAAQTATLTNTGTVPLTISSAVAITGTNAGDFSQTNNCPASGSTLAATTGNTCAINVTFTPTASGTRTAILTVGDNAGNSPQTINLTGTGAPGTVNLSSNTLTFSSYLVGVTSPTMSVTVTNSGGASLTIASIVLGGTNSADFALTTGTNVCNYAAGQTLATNGSCSIYATFTPASVAQFAATITVTDNSGGVSGTQQIINLSGTGFNNTAQLNVSLGLTGNYENNITTSVTVCVPGTTTCTTIPDVLVDTGSVGLRLLASGADNVTGAQVGSLGLPTITDSSTGYPLYECVEYGDLSYTFGQMAYATVTVGGETATQVPSADGGTANGGIPIQIVSTNTPPSAIVYEGAAYYDPCIYNGSTPTGGPNAGTVANLGSNGILGIGNFPQDCALAQNYCTNISTTTGQYLEFDQGGVSINGTTYNYLVEPTPLQYQAWNPVSTFATDNTGSILTLPAITSSSGTGPLTGTLTFGIGTETNNALGSATVYEMDTDGNLNSVTFNGVTYTSTNSGGSFLDSGSNAYYVSDETILTAGGVTVSDCLSGSTDTGWYCAASTQSLSLTIGGFNGTSNGFTLSIGNEPTLSATGNAAFNDFAGPSCEGGSGGGCSATTDYWDLGLPFFFGRPNGVFIGISEGATYPNGYWAF